MENKKPMRVDDWAILGTRLVVIEAEISHGGRKAFYVSYVKSNPDIKGKPMIVYDDELKYFNEESAHELIKYYGRKIAKWNMRKRLINDCLQYLG